MSYRLEALQGGGAALRPGRGSLIGGVVLLLAGLGALAWGAVSFGADAALTLGQLGGGLGLMLGGASALVSHRRRPHLELSSKRGGLWIRAGRDEALLLPEVVSKVVCQRFVSVSSTGSGPPRQSVTWGVVLHKRDGGRLELARFQKEDLAREVAVRFSEGFEEVVGVGAPVAAPSLEGSPSVKVRHEGAAVIFAWPTRWRAELALLGLSVAVGATSLAWAGWVALGEWPLLLMAGCFSLVAAVVVGSLLWSLPGGTRVRVDEGLVTVTTTRGGRARGSRELPLERIVAVDYSNSAGELNAPLVLRTPESLDVFKRLERLQETVEEGAAAAAALEIFHMSRAYSASVVQLPTGHLNMAAVVALELALGEAVALRSGREPGEL